MSADNKAVKLVQKSSRSLRFRVGSHHKHIPEGEYKATVASIDPGTYRGKRPILIFRFIVADGPHKDVELRGFVNINHESYGERSKLYRWYAAATGSVLLLEEEINTEHFFDRVLLVQVGDRKSSSTPNVFSDVVEIIRTVFEI